MFLHQVIVFIEEHSVAAKLERYKITEVKMAQTKSSVSSLGQVVWFAFAKAGVYSETRRTQSLEGMNTEGQEETRVLLVCAGEMA